MKMHSMKMQGIVQIVVEKNSKNQNNTWNNRNAAEESAAFDFKKRIRYVTIIWI